MRGVQYHDVVVFEAICEGAEHGIFVLLLDYTGGSRKYAESTFALTGLCRLAGLEETAEELRPRLTYDITSVNCGFCDSKTLGGIRTLLGVLPSDLGNGVANLVPDLRILLAVEALEKLLPDDVALRLGEGEKKFLGLVCRGVLATPGSYAPEKHTGKRACLSGKSAAVGKRNRPHIPRGPQTAGYFQPTRLTARQALRRPIPH